MFSTEKVYLSLIFVSAVFAGLVVGNTGVPAETAGIAEEAVNAASHSANKALYSTPLKNSGTPVFLIVTETTRADHVGPCYGYERETAPNMCDFAEDSVMFENAYAPASYTHATIPAMFTSTPPNAYGTDAESSVSEEAPMIAEKLGEEGYNTTGFSDHPSLNKEEGFMQGFESVHIARNHEIEPHIRELNPWDSAFTFIFFRDQAHAPYIPDQEYMKWGDPPSDGVYINPHENTIATSNATVQDAVDAYDAEIRQVDDRVGKVLDYLSQEGLYEESLIIVTSDHGEGFMEHGELGHAAKPYEEQIKVPLFVKFPGNEHGGEAVETPVSLLDVAPTIYNVTGVEPESKLFGESLVPEEKSFGNLVYASSPGDHWSIRDGSMKYLLLNTEESCITNSTNSSGIHDRMYDLESDPRETDNIVDMHPDKATELREELCDAYLKGRKIGSEPEEAELTESMEDKLRELGYLE